MFWRFSQWSRRVAAVGVRANVLLILLVFVGVQGVSSDWKSEWKAQYEPGGWQKIHPFSGVPHWSCVISADGNKVECSPASGPPCPCPNGACTIDKDGNIKRYDSKTKKYVPFTCKSPEGKL